MYICVDFDGTIVDHCFPEIGAEAPGAIHWLKRLQDKGARLILFTMRSDTTFGGPMLTDAVEFLESRGIRLYGINTNPDQDSWTNSPKAYGDIYVDDAAFGCPLIHPQGFRRPCVDWETAGPVLLERVLRGR
ncbi:MAG: hypothetical protein KJO60_07745 [Desulfofustis sp.]|nr:hypothetical protein [Desulfofustis sp.]MBT8354399.1 hypothetical protein [Desulfofustis sp.]NNK58372.1 hypothetical protein [Desulfofustis sp.]